MSLCRGGGGGCCILVETLFYTLSISSEMKVRVVICICICLFVFVISCSFIGDLRLTGLQPARIISANMVDRSHVMRPPILIG